MSDVLNLTKARKKKEALINGSSVPESEPVDNEAVEELKAEVEEVKKALNVILGVDE